MTRYRFKPTLAGILLLFFLAAMSCSAGAQTENVVTVTLDGRVLSLQQPATMYQGRVMVPLRGVFENLGATVHYDPAARSIIATRPYTRVVLFLDSRAAMVNGESRILDVAPIVIDGRILVPLRFVSEAMGAEVRWEAYDQTAVILSRTGGVDVPSSSEALPYPKAAAPAVRARPSHTQKTPQILKLYLLTPAPGAKVPRLFDVRGTTRPHAIVRIRVVADKSWLGFFFGVNHDEIMNTYTEADDAGNYHFRVDTGNLASGTHMTLTMHAEEPSGELSDETHIELTRE